MMSNHLSRCKIHKFTPIKNIAKDCSQHLVMSTEQTTYTMALKLFQTLSF